MAHSDSEEDILEDEFDIEEDADAEPDDETPDIAPDDVTEEGDDESSDESDDGSDEEEEEEEDEAPPLPTSHVDAMEIDQPVNIPPPSPKDAPSVDMRSPSARVTPQPKGPSPPPVVTRKRSLSPAHLRRKALAFNLGSHTRILRSYTVEAICALPHPVPTHALASSFCMTHLLTGSDDGYIRDYDIFPAVNGKNFLTAPQRHHAGVVEGLIKAAQIRFWWENPSLLPDPTRATTATMAEEDSGPVPVYSLAMHSDALWSLAGTDSGHINLFTVRHEPGRLVHVMNKHKGPVSALCLDYDEKGFFSAGWDGDALQWDLNNGQIVRNFTAHGAQLAGIAVRPITSGYVEPREAVVPKVMEQNSTDTPQRMAVESDQTSVPSKGIISADLQSSAASQPPQDMDAKSDASFDPLFDDDPDEDKEQKNEMNLISDLGLPDSETKLAMPGQQNLAPVLARPPQNTLPVPKNAPPLLDPVSYISYSPDLIMTASIDGQVILWDRRVNSPGKGVGRLWMSEKTPPWCLSACWSADGGQIYAGRRNGTVDVWDVRQLGYSGPASTPRLLKILRNPLSSGVVSCVVAFPDGKHIACASVDNLRLWNVAEANEPDASGRSRSGVQFKIIPGHHGGSISQMLVDPGARFLVSASSNRGWHGDSTRTVFVHDIKAVY